MFEANKPIIADLKAGTGPLARVAADQRSVVVRHETYEHSYPHCWRCRNPLVYKAVSSWFVRVSQFRDRMVELNQQITWTPEHIKDGQFGKWLSNARDWSISRNRYWGTPIPVWVSDDPSHPRVDVYGCSPSSRPTSAACPVDEAGVADLHRPFIDDLTRPNPDDPTGASTMRRIPDVFDVWFDSGSMPFAQVHYPFENADWFEHHYPGDFIVEYIGQTRGWFYTLHVLATAIFDRPAFKNVMCHGIVLGDDGRKASKSLRNFPDPVIMWDKYGSDAVRWSLMSSPILRGGNLVVTEEGIRDGVRQVLLPLWSTYYFFTLYSGAAGGWLGLPGEARRRGPRRRHGAHGPLRAGAHGRPRRRGHRAHGRVRHRGGVRGRARAPRRAHQLVRAHPARPVLGRGRRRVRHPVDRARDADPRDGAARPAGHRGGLARSDRRAQRAPDGLADPDEVLAADADLVRAMDQVRAVTSTALGLRKANSVRVRQPLHRLTVAVDDPSALAPYTALLAAELNVKAIDLEQADAGSAERFGISQRLAVNARAAGPRLGRGVQAVIQASRSGAWRVDGETVVVTTADGDVALEPTEYELTTVVAGGAQDASTAAVLPGGGFVVLDLTLDDVLLAEGYARDVVRAVQDARKAAGLQVGDRIVLALDVPREHVGAVEEHQDFIARETLAVGVTIDVSPTAELAVKVDAVEAGGYEA